MAGAASPGDEENAHPTREVDALAIPDYDALGVVGGPSRTSSHPDTTESGETPASSRPDKAESAKSDEKDESASDKLARSPDRPSTAVSNASDDR